MKKIAPVLLLWLMIPFSLAISQNSPAYNTTDPIGEGSIYLFAEDSTLEVAPEGGYISFDVFIQNHLSTTVRGFIWGEVINLQTGDSVGPLKLMEIALDPYFGGIFESISLYIPACIQSGNYRFIGKIGCYPESVASHDFEFSKISGEGSGSGISGFECSRILLNSNAILPPNTVVSDCQKVDGNTDYEIIPQILTVRESYPNPFNTTTTLNFILDMESNIKIESVNIKGQVIETILNQRIPVGTYDLSWEANNYPSGVYFLKFSTPEQTIVKKVTLLK